MPGQMRGSKRGRGASRGARGGGAPRGGGGRGVGGRGVGGRGVGVRGASRGRSSSREVVVGRQNDDSFPPRGRNSKRGRGGADRGDNLDRRWRMESGSVHSSSGQEMKEPSNKMSENEQSKTVVDEEPSKTSMERPKVGKKGKKGGKTKADCKAFVQSVEGSLNKGSKANLPTGEVKLPELRKPETKSMVKNPKMNIAKESPPSVHVKRMMQRKDVAHKSDEVKSPVEASATLADDSKLNITKNTSLPMNASYSTGLKVLSITSSFPGYVFTTNDRAKFVRSIPGVVIINTANKGDKLVLGVEMEDDQLPSLLHQFEDQKNWKLSYVDTTDKDTFAYFAGWKLIPRVDKSGMFQLIVNLRTQGSRSRDAEMKRRNQLLDLVKDLNIVKIVHGEGETILLVSHVLECVAYSDLIRKMFTLEKRHTWLPKPVVFNTPVHHPGKERHFWVKVKDSELNNLTTAHKQYTVYHQLSNAGKVLQLEHQLFGVEDNYLVVYSDMGDTKMPVLGQQFCLLELLPDALPDVYTPSYGVDAWGFYSVSGKFPENVSNEARNRFAEDMKKVGAVGFRSGEAEDTFSLHFVNSRCLEQISRCAQFSSFRLTILSSLVRKPRFEKTLMKMVPSILKYKELKLGDQKVVKSAALDLEGIAASYEKKPEEINVMKQEKIEPTSKVVKDEENSPVKDLKLSKKAKTKVSKEKIKPTKGIEAVVANEVLGVSEMSNKNVVMIEKAREALKNVEHVEKEESWMKLSESELLKICWKKEGSLHTHLASLGNFVKALKEVVVSEAEHSNEVVFSFPEKKVIEVLNLMSSDGTNSLEKIKSAPQKVQVQASKFFKNKFGVVLEKNSTISQLKEDFSKFGVEIEVRSHVFVLWCDSKLGFYKMLTDPETVSYKLVPCSQNFKFAQIKKKVEIEDKRVAKTKKKANIEEKKVAKIKKKADIDEKKVEVLVEDLIKVEPVLKPIIQLTEREIFGFIWQKTSEKINIRDDQVISRQLTNFIKTVVCEDMSTDEDGLVVTFSTEADKTAALTKFCPSPVPDREQLAALSRKFTLLPSRGFFGLFSVKRVKPEHFTRFGDCKIRNCGIWFTDKLSMCTVLRDPFISKAYPTLFIDCRNIYILSSQKTLPQIKPDIQEKPAASSSLKTCHAVISQPSQGVVTRSATARTSIHNPTTPVSEEAMKTEEPEKLAAIPTPDPAILTAVASPVPAPATPCPLLNTLLSKPALTVLGQGKFGYNLGKVGHIPSARLVRTGYKQSKIPDVRVRDLDVEDLFLEDKECYRSKDIKEAASLISNILEGKMSEVAGNSLREIKMKRVEHFLKDKLGVECRLSKEGKDKLQAGGMIIENDEEITQSGQEIEKKEVTNIKIKFEEQTKEVKGIDVENVEISNEVVVDNPKDQRKQMLLKREAERREFEKQVLIFPEELVHEVEITSAVVVDEQSRNDVAMSGLESLGKPVDESPFPNGSKNVEDSSQSVSSTKNSSSIAVLTPDLMGFYTLTLPVPQGSDLNILSSLQEDISWFDTPVSLLCIENISGGATLEVKFRDQDIAMAVLQGLKHKYPGLEGDETGKYADIVKAMETGLFTLCFTDSKRKRYKATTEKFRFYGKLSPVISRGVGTEQVLVAFHMREEAVLALKENFDSEEFPELHVAPVSRG